MNPRAMVPGPINLQYRVGIGRSCRKIGFVKPEDATVSLSTGDILQSQDFTNW